MKLNQLIRAAVTILMLNSIILHSAGCSKETSVINESYNNESALQEKGTPTDAPYTLKLVYIGTPQLDEQLVEEQASEYLQDKINARLDLVVLDWGSWDNRQNILIAAREEIDIIFTSQWSKHAVNVSKGAFIPLNELLQQYGQHIINSLDPIIIESAQIDGINYGVPTNKEFAAQGGIVYRKDIAEQLGLDMNTVRTLDDLDRIYSVVKKKHPSMTPLFIKYGENFNSHYINNFDALGDTSIPGYILKDEAATVVKPIYEFDRYIDSLYLARDFYVKGYINSDAATTQMMVNDALASNEYFSIVSPIKPGKAEELGVQTGLVGKLGQIAVNHKTLATSETTGSMLAISSTSHHPELAMQLINLLHSDSYLNNLLNFGIEGVHYEKVSDNVVAATPSTSRYSPGANWMLGNQFLNYLWDTEDSRKWEQFKQFNEHAIISPGLGFVFDGDDVKSEVAAVVNVDKQYLIALESGSVDPDVVLPEYIKKLKIAGIDKIIEAKQKQFDDFLAKSGKLQGEM